MKAVCSLGYLKAQLGTFRGRMEGRDRESEAAARGLRDAGGRVVTAILFIYSNIIRLTPCNYTFYSEYYLHTPNMGAVGIK